ncbi:MAG: hypothetical protein V8R40_07965 [Dysosmobacter sp.]
MQFAATHPLNRIRRVQIYNNIKRYRETELDKILQETGGSFAFGGPIFLSNLTACCHLKGDGVVYGAPDYQCGAWHGAPMPRTTPCGGCPVRRTTMWSAWPSIVEGDPLAAPHYQPDMGGGRPRRPSAPRRGGLPISSPRRPTPRRSCGTCWRPPAGTAR